MFISDSAVECSVSASWLKHYLKEVVYSIDNKRFEFDSGAMGLISIDVTELELKSLSIDLDLIAIGCHVNLQIAPQDLLISSKVSGKMHLVVHLSPSLDGDSIRSNLVVAKLDWLHKPEVKLAKVSFAPVKVMQKILTRQIPAISDLLEKEVDSRLNDPSFFSQLATFIRPVNISNFLVDLCELSLVIQRLQLEPGRIRIGAKLQARLALTGRPGHEVVLKLKFKKEELWPSDSQLVVGIQLSEINAMISGNLALIQDLISNGQITYDHLLLGADENKLCLDINVTKPLIIPIRAELDLSYDNLVELLTLNELSVSAVSGAGLLARGLLFLARTELEKVISQKFPLKLSPLREMMEDALKKIVFVRWSGELTQVESLKHSSEIIVKIRKNDRWLLDHPTTIGLGII